MPIWVIQCVEALAVPNGQDLSDSGEPLFVGRFVNKNYVSVALHEGGIAGVVQDKNEQDNDNDNEYSNTDEEPDDPNEIALDPEVSSGEITGVNPLEHLVKNSVAVPPENPVELPAVAPP